MNFNEESAIAALCDQFEHVFSQIRELRQQSAQTRSSNESLQNLVDEELQQYKHHVDNYKALAEESHQNDHVQDQVLLDKLNQQVSDREVVYNLLLQQRSTQNTSSQEERQIKLQLHDHMIAIRQEIDQMKANCEQHRAAIDESKSSMQESTLKIEDYQTKIQLLEQSILESDAAFRLVAEKHYNENEELKSMQNDLRGLLRTQTTIDEAVKDYEKVINKLWLDIEKKSQRLQIIQQNQQLTNNKLAKSREQETIYNKYRDSNTTLATENVQIREQLQQFINSLPPELKNSQASKIGGQSKRQSSHNLQVQKLLCEAICQNHIKIKEMQEVKKQQTDYFQDTMVEVNHLEQTLQQLRSNVEILSQQYQTMQEFALKKHQDSLGYSESKGDQHQQSDQDVRYFDERDFQDYLKSNYPQYSETRQDKAQ